MQRSSLLAAMLAAAFAFVTPAALGQAQPALKIGVLNDMSGTQADLAGMGSVEAARLAIEDYRAAGGKRSVELLSADHQNRPDVGVLLARQWFDRDGVEAIFDVQNSAVALAVNHLLKDRNKLAFFSTPITDRMTEEDCNGRGLGWTWDTYSIVRTGTLAQIRRGLDTWFVIGFDYAAGVAFENAVREAVQESGGKLVGAIRAPIGAGDYSSALLRAQASKAKVIAVTLGGNDLVNLLKQAREYEIGKNGNQKLVIVYAFDNDIHAAGLAAVQGLELASPFYWNKDDRSRAFAGRFMLRHKRMPNFAQAGVYSAVLNYLKAVDAVGAPNGDKVVAQLQKMKIEDAFARNGKLLPNGRLIHDVDLVRVKSPAESKGAWDYMQVVSTVPAQQAFRPIAQSKCPLVRK